MTISDAASVFYDLRDFVEEAQGDGTDQILIDATDQLREALTLALRTFGRLDRLTEPEKHGMAVSRQYMREVQQIAALSEAEGW